MTVTPDPFDLNLRHLRALGMIVSRGSMSAAAEGVSLSQPALTQGLSKLEHQLSVTLFERRRDGMIPTAAGQIMVARAAAAFTHLAHALRGGTRRFARPEHLMTATQLHAFIALAQATGFAGAAAATGTSQPALHRAVRDLEQLCGVALVERRGRGMGLTAAGHKLARGVRLAAREIAAAIIETRPSEEARGGRIVVGAMPLSRARILPRAIAKFTALAPKARIEVVEGSWRELVDPLRDGIIDIMIGALRDVPPPDLKQEPLQEDHLSIIARSGHPLAGDTMPDQEMLAGYPWIVGQAGTPLRAQWERLFAGITFPAAPVECGSVMVIREILRHSDFLALLSRHQVSLELQDGILGTVGPSLPRSSRTIGITRREDWWPTPAQSLFLELLRQNAIEAALPEN